MRALYLIAMVALPLVAFAPVAARAAPPLVSAPMVQARAPTLARDLAGARDNQSWMRFQVRSGPAAAPAVNAPDPAIDWGFPGVGTGGGARVDYRLAKRWRAHAQLSQQVWYGRADTHCLAANPALRGTGCGSDWALPRLLSSAVGASFVGNGFSIGMDFVMREPERRSPLLPRVVPQPVSVSNLLSGLPMSALNYSNGLHARGRVAIGADTGIDVGATMGRIQLLPGNPLGIDTLTQKSLSLGVDRGALSGHIVGRMLQPEAGAGTALADPGQHWTSIDLGITWHLPWQGALSFGAQNMWTSGSAPKSVEGPGPDPSRIPYVQYHQDF